VGAVGKGIEPDRAEPGSQQAGVLARRHGRRSIDPAWKERLTLVQVLLLQPATYSLAGLLGDLELNRPARLPLHDSGSGPHPFIEGHIVDPKRDQVTGSQLAVEGKIEQGQITNPLRDLEPDPNGPDLLALRGGLGPISLPRFQGAVVRQGWSEIMSCIAVLLKRSPRNEPWPLLSTGNQTLLPSRILVSLPE
jgi:hypothetical protein